MIPNLEDRTIKISLTFARYVLAQATLLVSHLYGQHYDAGQGRFLEHPEFPGTPLVDEIMRPGNEFANLLHWCTSSGALLRTLAGILSWELSRSEELGEDTIGGLSSITLQDDISEYTRQLNHEEWPPAFDSGLVGWSTYEEYLEYLDWYYDRFPNTYSDLNPMGFPLDLDES